MEDGQGSALGTAVLAEFGVGAPAVAVAPGRAAVDVVQLAVVGRQGGACG